MSRPVAEPARRPLSRERVLAAALAVADVGGLTGLTIRSLAQELGVKPMSVYHHVSNKDEILDGLVDLVFGEIRMPEVEGDWQEEVRHRSHSAREVLLRHPWAVALMETRTSPGVRTLDHHEAMLGLLLGHGFSLELAGHAYVVIDAYVYGFVIQEISLPFEGADEAAEVAESILDGAAQGAYPHLAAMAATYVSRPDHRFGDQFDFGLDLVLEGLAARLAAEQ